jgi:hypothetical protein
MPTQNRLYRELWQLRCELADLYLHAQAAKAIHDARCRWRQKARAIREKVGKLLAWARSRIAAGRR